MNIKKFIPKIGFALTLLGLSLSATGFQRISDYGLAGIITLAAIMLLFENKISKPWWKIIVRQAEDLDVTYIAFGLGLMLASSKFVSGGWGWAGFLLLVAGVLFAGAGIGQLIGKGANDILKANAKIGIVIGFLILILGVVLCIMTWNSIVEKPLSNAPTPILIVGLGIILSYFGWRKWRKSRSIGRS